MNLKGELISKKDQNMVWVRDKKGAEFICYGNDLKSQDHVSEDEKHLCLESSQILGPNW